MAQNYTFDGPNRIIQLENTSSFSITDAYSRWKEWLITGTNAMYPQAFSYVGGEPTTPGKFLGTTYFLKNNWKFRPYSINHVLDVDGNIYTDDSNSPNIFVTSSGDVNVTIRNTISNLNEVQVIDAISGATLNAIENKIIELWKIHGLDSSKPLTVTTSSRSVDDINQTIVSVPNQTTVTRS